jgi:hypothetical protein
LQHLSPPRTLLCMKPMDRRRFLYTAAATATLPSLSALAQSKETAITLHKDQPGPTVPLNFVGVSCETQQLSDPSFFTAANHGLVAQFKALAPHGVLRLGGNTSDYGYWKPTPTSVMPPRTPRPYKVGDPDPNTSYAVTPLAVRNLKAFLDATGWTCLYGINLGTNIPSLAADEALFVSKTLGPKLEYFQIGNEADRFASTIRDPKVTGHPWTADAFLDEWLTFAKAIIARVPNAKFGLPDVASNAVWIGTIGDRLANDPIRSHVACITHHYYIGGPPSNPDMTIARILKTDPRVQKDAAIVRSAADKLHTAYRMTEGNTCYRGGKPGVSDVFAAALWSADYFLTLASLGYAGVNYLLEPVAYGMKFAGYFAGSKIFPIDFDPGTINATAYAAKTRAGKTLLAVINKDATQTLHLKPMTSLIVVEKLSAPSTASDPLAARSATLARVPKFSYSVPPATAILFGSLGL